MLPAILLIPVVALYRIVMAWQMTGGGGAAAVTGHPLASWLPGFCPLSAVALCAGTFLPRRLALPIPLGILLASDLVIDAHYGAPFFTLAMFGRYALLAVICLAGLRLGGEKRRAGPGTTLLAAVAASTFFYVTSNTLTWAGSPDYAQTVSGWTQALTTGLPGYLPSWYFYRNALVSDCLYSMVFVACLVRGSVRSAESNTLARHAVPGTVQPQ